MSVTATPAVEHGLDRLRSLDLASLRLEWQRLWGTPAPRLSRDLLTIGLGYRLQEQQFGGLARTTQLALRTMSVPTRRARRFSSDAAIPIKPGTRLLREWQGHTHIVTVVADGFEFGGTVHRSLTTIAKAITGAHWSGPRFFGLLRPDKQSQTGGPARRG